MDLVELTAIEAIKKLKARYFYCIDHKDWDGWRNDVFMPDASMLVPEDRPEPRIGIEEIITYLAPILDGVITVHHGHTPQIEITSPTTATGLWAMEDLLIWPTGKRTDGFSGRMQGYGHYHETYVCQHAGWRIKSLKLTRLHVGPG